MDQVYSSYNNEHKANFIDLYFSLLATDSIPNELRIALASHYLSTYRNISLWGSDDNPAPVEFDALYTDMEYVKINREANVQEERDLNHYIEMLVREFYININRFCAEWQK